VSRSPAQPVYDALDVLHEIHGRVEATITAAYRAQEAGPLLGPAYFAHRELRQVHDQLERSILVLHSRLTPAELAAYQAAEA
jgi:hypothetical protein